ncbi:hypothetical protein ACJBU6_08129 [Exserohilum turcicum]
MYDRQRGMNGVYFGRYHARGKGAAIVFCTGLAGTESSAMSPRLGPSSVCCGCEDMVASTFNIVTLFLRYFYHTSPSALHRNPARLHASGSRTSAPCLMLNLDVSARVRVLQQLWQLSPCNALERRERWRVH